MQKTAKEKIGGFLMQKSNDSYGSKNPSTTYNGTCF